MPTAQPIDLAVRHAIAGELPEFHPRAVARAALAGQFSLDDGLEALARIQAQRRAPRPVGQPRPSPRARPWQDAGCRYTPELSLDATLNLGTTAHRVLSYVTSLCGRHDSVVTLTASIAKALGRGKRCIQYAYRALEAAGFIQHTWDRRTGIVTITILPAALPKPPDPPEEHRKQVQVPTPDRTWLEKFRARCARIARMGRSALGNASGGAQPRARINRLQ